MLMTSRLYVQVGIVDLDICGPSVPKLLGVQGQSVINSEYGWVPIRYVQFTSIKNISWCTISEKELRGVSYPIL